MSEITSSTLKALIDALRAETEKDSISPENVGYILQQIVDYVDGMNATGLAADVQAALSKAQQALSAAQDAVTTANGATTVATAAGNLATTANTNANNADSNANQAIAKANAATSTANAAKAAADAAADAVEALQAALALEMTIKPFSGVLGGDLTLQQQSSLLNPGESGSYLVYSSKFNRLLLCVPPETEEDDPLPWGTGSFYMNWPTASSYGTPDGSGVKPFADKIYFATIDRKFYFWYANMLQMVGVQLGVQPYQAYPGNLGAENAAAIAEMQTQLGEGSVLDIGDMTAIVGMTFAEGAGPASSTDGAKVRYNPRGNRLYMVVTDDGTRTYYKRWKGDSAWGTPDENGMIIPSESRLFISGQFVYHWNGEALSKINPLNLGTTSDDAYPGDKGAKNAEDIAAIQEQLEQGVSAIGNCYNVTNERIKAGEPNGAGLEVSYYDTFESAVTYTDDKGKKGLGMQMTYAAAAGSWKTWQYIGTDFENFTAPANWIDMASLSAGDEPFINVNHLTGHPSAFASLPFAIAELVAYESRSGITYRKRGLVLHYRTDDQTWESKKFTGDPESEFQTLALWQDFGGTGSAVQVETKDEPEAGGTDAFSTEGAAQLIPVDRLVTRDGATTTVTLLNTKGEPIFDPIDIISSGGGEASGSTIGITAKDATVYAAYGMPMAAKFAVRSETVTGGTTLANAIEKIEIIDRDTNQSVYSWSGSVDSADSLDKADEDWNFEIDLQSIFSSASIKRLRIEATDELGKTATKAFQAVAEDVTVTCNHKLDYNSGNNVDPSAASVTLDFYKFESTTSAVRAYVDILIGGEWVNVHDKLLSDNTKNYAKSITFSPSALGLEHGSYLMRVYGVSENSGVKGNTVYTTLFCVDPESDDSLVGISYDDRANGTIRNYDSALVKVAAYKKTAPFGLDVDVAMGENHITTVKLLSNQTEPVDCRVLGYEDGSVITIRAHVGAVFSPNVTLVVEGSAVDVALKENAAFNFSFRNRSNSETDRTISHNGYTLALSGANYTSNGFVDYLGERCLRVAEGVTASLNYAPFGVSSIESNGMAWQLRFATDNIEDSSAILLDCYNPAQGAGFYIKGNELGIGVLGGTRPLEIRRFDSKKFHTLLIVAEPGSIYEERSGTKYGRYYAYFDGEKIGRVAYAPGQTPSALYCTKQISIDSTHGDLYITDMTAWRSYIEWSEAMGNYLAILNDVTAMKTEHDFENVLRVQSAEEVQMMRPQIQELLARGISCTVYVGSKEDFERFDSGTDTSENFYFDVYHYNAVEWRSFIAYHVRVRRQGTTSAKRCKKNTREYYKTATSIVPMYPNYAAEHALTPEQLADLDITYSLFALNYVRIGSSTIPVQVATNKVDFSNSSGANDSGTCNMMNATFRSLAQTDPRYLTPAQRSFDGTWAKGSIRLTGLQMNHSTANMPLAIFRSVDNMQSCYFEAKANFKEDKGEQVALGFINTPGYNMGCKNWQDGDFVAVWGSEGETLDQLEARFKAMTGLDESTLYLLKPYCSRNYRFMRWNGTGWASTTGSMRQVGGQWQVSGDVLNPVDGYEMLTYTGMNWCQGVSSLEDMMGGTTNYSSWVQKLISKGKLTDGAPVPAWTTYFESMVDSDDLALAYAQGKTVPFELYKFLRFCDRADYASRSDWQAVWHDGAYKYLSLHSNYVTRAAEDYNHMADSVSKNKQPMFFLEDGHCVENGVYDPELSGASDEDGFNFAFDINDSQQPLICYFNKIYDIDGANEDDNDGGGNADPEEDPDKPSDAESGYQNSWAGWGSVLFKACVGQDTAVIDAEGSELSYRSTVAAMRSCQTTLEDGTIIKPFSPEGAIHYYIDDRAKRWPKNVSSFDGWRKYESYTATSDAIYFYALRGLGLASTPQFVKTRWRFRDGYYKTGDFFAQDGTISGRIEGASDAVIRVKAAKAGYFGVGNDSSGAVSERVYLEAGQEHEFTEFRKDNGALLYIYQADRMEEIDLSDLTLSTGFNFSNMRLAKKIILGGEEHINRPMAFDTLSSLPLGSLPFLDTLDIRGTLITTVNAEGCPRLRHLLAAGSVLGTVTLAETAPINDISLPETMTELKFTGLPELTYSQLNALGGLQVTRLPGVNRLQLERDPKLNGCALLRDVLGSQEDNLALRHVRLGEVILRGPGTELLALVNARWSDTLEGTSGKVGGIGDTGETERPVINGTYMLEQLLESDEVEAIEEGIQGITVEIVVEAYTNAIAAVNAESYGGEEEAEEVTTANVGEHLLYYNGETYDQWLERYTSENMNINDTI